MSNINGRCESCQEYKEQLVNGYADCPYPIPPFWLCEDCLESLGERQEERKAAGECVNLHDELVTALNGALVALKLGAHVDQQAAIEYGLSVLEKVKAEGREP